MPPAAIFKWPTPSLGSFALVSGWMAATSTQIPLKTGKPSGNIWAVSVALALTKPMMWACRGQLGQSSWVGIHSTMILVSRTLPNCGTDSIFGVGYWIWHPVIWVEGSATSHDLLIENFSSSGQPMFSAIITVYILPNMITNHPCTYIWFLKNK